VPPAGPGGPALFGAPPAGAGESSPFGSPPPGAGTPWPPLGPDDGGPRRNTRRLVVAGGTAAALTLTRDRNDAPSGGTGPTAVAQSAAGPVASASEAAPPAAAPMPTDALLVRVDTGADSSNARTTKIFSFKPGTDARTPLAGSLNGDVLPKWSHDRETVAVTNRKPGTNEIYLMNRDGQNRRKILDGVSLGRVAWSPDDTKLAFMRPRNGVNQIFLQTLDNSASVQLTTGGEQKDDPAFSADGQSIIYWRIVGGVRQIFELNIGDPEEPGRRIVNAANGPANDPMPSPDGTTLLYTKEADAKVTTSDIWIINMDGTNPRRLTSDPAREMDATWSPDGTWLAFVRGQYERPTVVAMRPDGTGETLLTKTGQREGHPCWA
jgi:Tol biopolymer transport system component